MLQASPFYAYIPAKGLGATFSQSCKTREAEADRGARAKESIHG